MCGAPCQGSGDQGVPQHGSVLASSFTTQHTMEEFNLIAEDTEQELLMQPQNCRRIFALSHPLNLGRVDRRRFSTAVPAPN